MATYYAQRQCCTPPPSCAVALRCISKCNRVMRVRETCTASVATPPPAARSASSTSEQVVASLVKSPACIAMLISSGPRLGEPLHPMYALTAEVCEILRRGIYVEHALLLLKIKFSADTNPYHHQNLCFEAGQISRRPHSCLNQCINPPPYHT